MKVEVRGRGEREYEQSEKDSMILGGKYLCSSHLRELELSVP
jgi:hypothetical protein